MGPVGRSAAARYAVAVLAAAVAVGVRLLIDPLVGDRFPYLFCALAIAAAAWYGGFGPLLLALLLSLPATVFLFVEPRHDLAVSVPAHQVQIIGFVVLSLTIGLFSERMRAARRRAEANSRDAERRRKELEEEIDRREQLELELQRRAEELAMADRLKDEFLAMLAHELRNPLGPIRNAGEAVRSLAPTGTDLHRAGEMIVRQAAHLGRLVDDLLDVSRITRGKVALQMERLDLTSAVTRAVEMSRPLLDGRRHELTVELPPQPVWVDGDATRLAQLLANLLSNAAKYTPDDGHVRLSLEDQAGEAVVRVRDDGLGIDAELMPRVFDLFVQGDRSPARSEGGLGIGLTLVKRLAELHGGRVEAYSPGPGQGSEFTVRLPSRPAPCSPAPLPTPAPARRRRRVLAVDDNVDAVESLALLLGMQGHEVRTAHDGPTALEEAEAFRPEVVILDVGLPGMDGHEVARRLRRREESQGVLIVALTGYGRDEDRRRSREAGIDRHLVKPVDPDDLRDLIGFGAPASS